MRLVRLGLAIVFTTAAFAAAGRAARADCDGAPKGDVFFVTDRAPLDDDQLFSGERGLTAARDAILTYGMIGVPPSRKTMSICSSQAVFLKALGKRFEGKKRNVLVYVHGYYTTFRTAVDNALAMQKTLRFPGPVIVYSWPSKVTSRLAYVVDEDNAAWSLAHFRTLLETLQKVYPKTAVSFAAHSLGARFAAEGIAFVRRSCPSCVGHAAFFAPDIDGDTLRAELQAAGRCSGKPPQRPAAAAPVVLYVSNKDVALRQSQRLHGHQRAGQAGSEMILCDGVDTVDVGYYRSSDKAGHTYQVDPPVVADAKAAFAGVSPAAPSRKLTRVSRAAGPYYELRR